MKAGAIEALSHRFVPWLLSHRRLVIVLAMVLAVVGVVGSVFLYSDLRSGIEELLPKSAPSVIAANLVGPKMRPTGRLSLVLEGSDPDAIERFADDLAVKLRALPKTLIDHVDYRTDEQDEFVRQFGLLYLDAPDLNTVRDRISARLSWERTHSGPLVLDDDPAPSLDFSDIEHKYDLVLNSAVSFRKGYFQAPEGKVLAVLIRPPEASTGMEFNGRLIKAVKGEIAALNPQKYDPALHIGYSGEVAEFVEEQTSLVADLTTSTITVFVLVLAALWLYFRRWGAIAAIFVPLLAGCAVTFGIAYVMIGHLNANTAFLGSIVVGNGINAGIIYVARYMEERRRKTPPNEAIRSAWATTLPATFVASFGAAVAYLSLATTDFRGFNQFGAVGFVGMTLCWLYVYLLLPPVLSVIEEWRPIVPGPASGPTEGFGRFTSLVERHPVPFRALSIVLILGCVGAMARYSGDLVEYDMSHVRSKSSIKSGAVFWANKIDDVFRAYLTPLVLWADTPAQLDKVVDALEARRKELGSQDPIREIRTLRGAVPADQTDKLPVVADIRRMLPPSRVKHLDHAVREKLQRLIPSLEPRAVTMTDLPDAFRRALIEKDGTTGRIALLFPKKVGTLDLHETRFIKDMMRDSITKAGVTAYAWSTLLLLSDIDDAIWHDGPQATLIAFLLVCGLVVIVLRKAGPSALVIGALLLGLFGLVGIAAAAQMRVNFLNFVVLPITFGIGVDYAINIVQRYRIEGVEVLGQILHETGGAVAMCSATTVIGYGSLMVADSQALAGFGMLAAIGEVTCLSTALFLLPAWLFSRKPMVESEGVPVVHATSGS